MNIVKLASLVLATSLTACGNSDSSTLDSKQADSVIAVSTRVEVSAAFTGVKAGVEYPTGRPRPSSFDGKKVLVISGPEVVESKRIIVDLEASLSDPIAGVDWPTDSARPAFLDGSKFLVLGDTRILISVEKAVAGIDFPTDGPAPLSRDFLVWSFSAENRKDLSSIYSIDKALAGVDFPTDGPADMFRDFYVVMTITADGFKRTKI